MNAIEWEVRHATQHELDFRHSGWAPKRQRVRVTLQAILYAPRKMEQFDQCGAGAWVYFCKEEQVYKIGASYCRCRHCEPCARARANLIAANLRNRLEQIPDGKYRFITLTLKHNDAQLRDQISRLYESFTKLRRLPEWKKSQHGGVTMLEVKWDPHTRAWHPHLHIVAEGGFMAQRELSACWLKCTGDSPIVDIRIVNSGKDAAHYVSKYVTKGTNNEVWHDLDAATEYVTAMKGTRSAATFGSWRGFKLLSHTDDKRCWTPVASLDEIVNAAGRKEEWATSMLVHLFDRFHYDPHKPRTRKEAKNAANSP